MEKENKVIKILKIESGKGYFLDKTEAFIEVDKIDRDSLFNIVSLVLDNDVCADEYKDELISNKVHQIIYKDLLNKINELKKNKSALIENATSKYNSIILKYSKK